MANNNKFLVKAGVTSFSPVRVWLVFLNYFPFYGNPLFYSFKDQVRSLSFGAFFDFLFRNEHSYCDLLTYLVLRVPSVRPTCASCVLLSLFVTVV